MPGPHGGYTQQELVDAGGQVYHPPSRQDITIVYYQPPGTTDRSQQIEFTQNPQTQEFHPKAGADTDRYNQYIGGGQGGGQAAPAPSVAASNAPTHSVTPSINPADRMGSAITPSADQWRDLVSQYFKPEDVDKALYVILHESGGNPNAAGDGGHSVGLFQLNNAGGLATGMDMNALRDPETNIRLAAQAVYGGSGWSPWGENALYNGNPFGSLGHEPYPGAPAGAASAVTGGGGRVDAQMRQGSPAEPSPPAAPKPAFLGYAPASAFPGFGRNHEMPDFQRGSKGDYPVYAGGRERNEFSLASAAPGSISLVSPQGGWGYNPFAIEAANGRFEHMPVVDVPYGTPAQNIPGGYGLNDYFEQARLAGSLVGPLSSVGYANRPGEVFVGESGHPAGLSAGNRPPSNETLADFWSQGQQNLDRTMEGSFGNGVGTSTSSAYAGGGHLNLKGFAEGGMMDLEESAMQHPGPDPAWWADPANAPWGLQNPATPNDAGPAAGEGAGIMGQTWGPYIPGVPMGVTLADLSNSLNWPVPMPVNDAFRQWLNHDPYHYSKGGRTVVDEPTVGIGMISGKPKFTIGEVRPEAMYSHGGFISIANHVKGLPRYDDGGEIAGYVAPSEPGITAGPSGGSAGGAPPISPSPTAGPGGGAAPPAYSPSPTAAPSALPPGTDSLGQIIDESAPGLPPGVDSLGHSDRNGAAPAPTDSGATSPAPWAGFNPSSSNFSGLLGLGDLTMPVLPTRPGFGASQAEWDAYDANLAKYYQDINARWSQGSAARTGLVNSLFDASNGSFPTDVARQQRMRDVTDYQYGKAGLNTPIEQLPPLVIPGTANPTAGLGPGLRYALLTPAQQFSRLYPLLGDYLSGLSAAPRPGFSSASSSSSSGSGGNSSGSGQPYSMADINSLFGYGSVRLPGIGIIAPRRRESGGPDQRIAG